MNEKGIHIIHEKLEEFIKRYYLQQSYQGLILLVASATSLLLIFSFLAYQFYLSSSVRTVLFFSFLTAVITLLIGKIIIPLSKYFNVTQRISNQKASEIIGEHFKNEVDDQLLNAILLFESDQNNELVLASIEQKSKKLKGIDFLLAIPYDQLKKLLKYASFPIAVLLVFVLWQPEILSEGSQRIVAYQNDFLPTNPYQFQIKNKSLSGIRNQDFTLELAFTGTEIPREAFIEINGQLHRLKQEDQRFLYTINHLSKKIAFKIKTGIYYSKEYALIPIDPAALTAMNINVQEPKYIGGKNYSVKNDGNLNVPEGTEITWNFDADFCDELLFIWETDSSVVDQIKKLTAKKTQQYSLILSNQQNTDPVQYSYELEVVKDLFPEISIQQQADTLIPGKFSFIGKIEDDYGFTNLQFHYKLNDSLLQKSLPFAESELVQNFTANLNFNELGLAPGEELEYYFTVSDNDGINGAKTTTSTKLFFTLPGKKSIDSLLNKETENLKNLMANAASKTQDLQKEFQEIKKLLVENKSLSWENQQKIQNFIEQQKALEKDLLNIQKQNKEKNKQQQSLSPQEQALLEKQEQLNKLFDELLDEETKKMFEELEKLMEELSEKNENLEKINLENENLEKSLDRTLELFKQMEFEQELEKTINELEQLAEEQEKLKEKTENSKNEDSDELLKEQEQLQQEFKRLEEKTNELEKKNSELEQERDFENTENEQKEINQALEQAKQKLSNKQQKGAAKQQKSGADAMKKMAKKLSQMQQKMQDGGAAEDLQTTRQLLENLIYLSVEQEKLLEETKLLSSYDPQFNQYIQKQQKLRQDSKVIEDSLFALSKRQIQLASFINKEMHEITFNSDKAIEYLSERRSQSAAINQQFVMTSANNLALILDEAIQDMQNSMMKQKCGTGSCNKPGGSNPKPGAGMKSLQEQLAKQMEQMKKQLKEGNQPGKSGKKGKNGEAMSFGKMAAQQSAIKEQLQKLSKELQKQGNGGLGNADQLKNELEKTEKELLNKSITPESIQRQQKILTRLLEAEKAIQEREYEDKREAQKSKNEYIRNPKDFLEYKKIEVGDEELLKITLPALNLFYKKKVNEYFNTLDK